MTMNRISAAINSSLFPVLYEQAFRSTVQNQDLSPRMPGTFYGSAEAQNFGIPQIIYMENALPVSKGVMSVSYAVQAAGPGGVSNFDQGILLRDSAENHRLFAPCGGANYVYDPANQTWASKSPFTFTYDLITRAYVNGRSFVFYEKTKLVEYNASTSTLTDLTTSIVFPSGYDITKIRGIGACAGYLLLFTDIEILWGSPLSILDFASIDTGAGSQTPEDIGGQITAIMAISGGALVYTQGNAVAMRYTKNTQSPFLFKGVNGSGGSNTWERIAAETDSDAHFAWTTAGIQRIGLDGSETLMTEVVDFLVGGIYESWNSSTKQVVRTEAGRAFVVKLALLLKRYLIISYGTIRKEMSNALVYDTVLKRWGRLTVTHTDCFEYTYPSTVGPFNYDNLPPSYSDLGDLTYDELAVTKLYTPPAKTGICFMQRDGALLVMTTNFTQRNPTGLVVIGRVQGSRGTQCTIQAVEVEGSRDDTTMQVTVLSSQYGKTRDFTQTAIIDSKKTTLEYANYNCRITGENHDIAIEGAFVLSSVILEFTEHGYR